MMDTSIVVDGLAVLWEEVLEFVGSKVCLDGNARHAIAHRTAQANKCMTKWRPVLRSTWLPRMMRLNIAKTSMWQAFLWSSSVWDDIEIVKRHSCKLECETGCACDCDEKTTMDEADQTRRDSAGKPSAGYD